LLYRCRECQHEEMGGFLPGAACGLYFVFLLGLSAACLAGGFAILKARLGEQPVPVQHPETKWWEWPVIGIITLTILIVAAAVVKFALELVEYLAHSRRKCPNCGTRRWSWGFTRGFGL
jgi:hypothetical protein